MALGRAGDPDEIDKAVSFLASDEATSYIELFVHDLGFRSDLRRVCIDQVQEGAYYN